MMLIRKNIFQRPERGTGELDGAKETKKKKKRL